MIYARVISSGAYYTNISILCYGGCTPLWYYIPYE